MMQHRITSMRSLCLPAASILALVAYPTAEAQAQMEPAPPPFEAAASTSTGFLTLDRGDESSFVDVSLATSFFEGEDPDFNARMELYGQYITPGGTGGYLGLPVSYLAIDDDSFTAVGNIEIGGLHNLQLNPKTNLVLRGGIALPTASDDFEKLFASLANINARYTDLVGVIPELTTLRIAASPVHRSGQAYLRADGGLDVPFSSDDNSDPDPLIRINLAAGLVVGKGTVGLEIVTIGTTGDVGDGQDRFQHTVALSGRFHLGSAELFGGLVLPAGSDNGFNVDMSLVAGARIPLAL